MITSQLYIDGTADNPLLIIKGRAVSLQALEKLTPSTLALLERLADPEMNGQVVRVEHGGSRTVGNAEPAVRLVKLGIAGRILHKAAGR